MSRAANREDEWDCLYCGSSGTYRPGDHPDGVPCPYCGEPVVPR